MSEILRVDQVTKTYGKKGEKQYQALKGISFAIEQGEFVGIMGASGSGKTTLLNILSTLDKPTSGHVLVNKQDITALKNNQMADFTNRENIALPLSLQGVKAKEIDGKAMAIAKRLGIESILDKYPAEISGGQKQRVASARALVHNPAILYGDEPTGALDSQSATELLKTMADLNKNDQVSILMVTHDPYSASYAQRILFIKDGKIGKEIKKENKTREEFYQDIIAELGRR